jgi:hypothetical protein
VQAHKVRTAKYQGVSHMGSSIQKENYMEKHIFLPTDFWIASIQTIQDQRIEDIYQEAGDRISKMTKMGLEMKKRYLQSSMDTFKSWLHI